MSKKKEGGKKVSLFPFGSEQMVKEAKKISGYSYIVRDEGKSLRDEKEAYNACVEAKGGSVEAKTKCAKKYGGGRK